MQLNNQNQTPPAPVQPEKKPFLRKSYIYVFIVTLVAVLGTFFILKQIQQLGGEEVNSILPDKPNLKSSVEISDMADWQTYRNEEYGFELQYPKNWVFLESFSYEKGFFISSNKSKLGILPRGEFDSGLPWSDPMVKTGLFAGKGTEITEWDLKGEGKAIWYKLIDNIPNWTNANRIEVQVAKEDFETFNQILSTFKFIEPKPLNLIQACPEEWIQNDMPPIGGSEEDRQYYILDGERRELEEFDTKWVGKNCNLGKQTVY